MRVARARSCDSLIYSRSFMRPLEVTYACDSLRVAVYSLSASLFTRALYSQHKLCSFATFLVPVHAIHFPPLLSLAATLAPLITH